MNSCQLSAHAQAHVHACSNTVILDSAQPIAPHHHHTTILHKIHTLEKKAFPSDIHAVTSQITHRNFNPLTSLVEVEPREGEICLRDEDIQKCIETHGE